MKTQIALLNVVKVSLVLVLVSLFAPSLFGDSRTIDPVEPVITAKGGVIHGGTFEGVFIESYLNTEDLFDVPINKCIHLYAEISGLKAEQITGKRLAFQIIKERTRTSAVQKKVIWVDIKKSDLEKKMFSFEGDYSFNEEGTYHVCVGVVDIAKHEWWHCTSTICKVKKK